MSAPARPQALSVVPATVPAALAAERRWLGWRYEWRDGKWTKVPCHARTGGKGSSTDPATWCSFEEALAGMAAHGLDGIGFALGDGFAGADFDACMDERGVLDATTAERLAALDSYAEVSPSGRGVKVLLRATLPPGRRRIGNVELYDAGRYFTITGRHLGFTPATVEERTAELAALHASLFTPPAPPKLTVVRSAPLADDEVLARTRAAANGSAFMRLWAGDTSGYGKDESRADCALIAHLSFFTQDREQLDRLFRRSGLMREKWERADYRRRTLDKGVSRAEVWEGGATASLRLNGHDEAAVDPIRPKGGITLAELQHKHFEPLTWIIPDLLPEGACVLAARAKMGKSWLALGLGLAVSMKGQAFAQIPVISGDVLYLDLEGTQRRIQARVRAMIGTAIMAWPDNFTVFEEWPRGQEGLDEIRAWVEAHPACRLVVIDVLYEFRGGMNLKANMYDFDRETITPINALAEELRITILIVHHTKKGKEEDVFDEISGSSGIQSAVSTMWVLTYMEGGHIKLSPRGRDLVNPEDLALRWDGETCLHVLDGTAAVVTQSTERKALLALLDDDEAHPLRELAAELGKSHPAMVNMLKRLIADGQVDKVGHGLYAIVRQKAYRGG